MPRTALAGAKSITDLGAVQKTLEPAVRPPDQTTAPDEDENAQGAPAGGWRG